MKEFCLALLNAINQFYPIHNSLASRPYPSWGIIVGSFTFNGNLYSFTYGNRGYFQRMAKGEKTEFFDLAGTPRNYTAIIYEGKRYEKEPTINFEST